MKLKQLNARVPQGEADAIKKDIMNVGTTQEAYVLASLLHFRRSTNIAQRRAILESAPKIRGRKVAVAAA